jgi:hypothetical protein
MDAFPVMAGTLSTVIFGTSMLPMLVKAARTKDLGSYSLGNIVLANVGNVIHFDLRIPPTRRAGLGAAHVLPGHHRADARVVPALHKITHVA